jgi:hypothetical protein
MKRFKILALPMLVAATAALIVTCNKSDTAFVTIDLNRPGKSYTHYQPGILNKIDALFSKKAYASTPQPLFPSSHGDLVLEVSATDLNTISASIPNDASSFTIEIPSGNNRKFSVYSYTTAPIIDNYSGSSYGPFNGYNFGGHKTLNLSPGESTNILILMLPMTKVITISGTMLECHQYTAGITNSYSYRIYRADIPEGPYTYINTVGMADYTAVSKKTYYYRVTMTGQAPVTAEGEMSWPPYKHTIP